MALDNLADGLLVAVPEVPAGPDLYEKEIEDLVWGNLELFIGDPLFPLRRQAVLPGGGLPDILALDKAGRVVVVEVKRDVDRRQLSQALEYAGWPVPQASTNWRSSTPRAPQRSSKTGSSSPSPRRRSL